MARRAPIGNASSPRRPPKTAGRTARRARRTARPLVSDREARRARSLRPGDGAKRTRNVPLQCRDASRTYLGGRRRSMGRRRRRGIARGGCWSVDRTSRSHEVGPAGRSITLRGDPVHVRAREKTSGGCPVRPAVARRTTFVHPVTGSGDKETTRSHEVETSARGETFSARSVCLRVREDSARGERLASSFDSRTTRGHRERVVA